MIDQITTLRRAIALMREAQDELDRGNHLAIAAHLETALGFADTQLSRLSPGLTAVEAG